MIRQFGTIVASMIISGITILPVSAQSHILPQLQCGGRAASERPGGR